MSEGQSYDNHAAMVPLYHYVALSAVFLPLVYFGWTTATAFSVGSLMMFVLAVGVLLVGFYARVFALGVQDRVIRLEERLRMERTLPDDLKARIEEVTTDQLIGLRFAPDEELADLTRRVLAGEISDRKSIKKAIRNWRPDEQRI